jgi:putative transposase
VADFAVLADMDVLVDQLVGAATGQGIVLTGEDGLLRAVSLEGVAIGVGGWDGPSSFGYDKYDWLGRIRSNSRSGTTSKAVTIDIGKVSVAVPGDRDGGFEPAVVREHQRRLAGFDQTVISLYAEGMTSGDIAKHLSDVYDTDVSKDLVSTVTDQVLDDMRSWQSRLLDRICPVILIDCIVLKIRHGQVANRPVYVALGISVEGFRDVLELWVGPPGGEGAKQSMTMLTELRNRSVNCPGV